MRDGMRVVIPQGVGAGEVCIFREFLVVGHKNQRVESTFDYSSRSMTSEPGWKGLGIHRARGSAQKERHRPLLP